MKTSFLIALGLFMALASVCMGQVEKGKATYYGDSWKGRRTASGERFHPDSLTCAHRTLPFGTLLLVSCPSRGTSVVVRVNDRGPFGKGRIVDLSSAAARKLGILLAGVADVELQVYTPEMMAPLFPKPVVPDLMVRREVVTVTKLNPNAVRVTMPVEPVGGPALAVNSKTKGKHTVKAGGHHK
jgi:rare lipoprotein A